MIAVTAALIALAAMSGTAMPEAKAMPHLLIGEFSNGEASFVAGSDRGDLKLGCAGGSIAGPIRLDGHGRFTASGEFQEYAPGPQMVDESGKPPPAVRFDGQLSGGSLALTVARRGGPPLTLTLTRGPARKMVRCL